MNFRGILASVAILAVVAACTPQVTPPQTSAASAGRGAQSLPREVERLVGPAYDDPKLQAYVDRVGQRIVAASGLPGSYRFAVLDQSLANAHAVPGYVFVTRGLLAILEDEAELAAAFSHELGHLVQRHAAQRARVRKDMVDAAVAAASTSGSVTVGRSVANEGLLALRRYSRDQELEADRLALTYITKAGYRGSAMEALIHRLRRQSQLEAQIMGDTSDVGDRPSASSTHPAPVERLEALAVLPGTSAPGDANQKEYFMAINGMSVDDPPNEGFVRGTSFVHPTLRLAFTAPAGFFVFNENDGVLAVGRDRSLMFFSCTTDQVEGRLDDWMRNKLKPTPTDIRATEIGGAEAAIGARPRGSDTGLAQARYVIVRHGERICYFNLMSEGPGQDRQIEVLLNAARSFRSLSDAEVVALKPYRLRIISPAGSTAAQLAARMPYQTLRMERLLVLNAADAPGDLTRRSEIKIVEP